MNSTFDFLARAKLKTPIIKEIKDGYKAFDGWVVGYYIHLNDQDWEHFIISSLDGLPVMIDPLTIRRCSGFSLRDDFMGDMHTLFEGDIVEYRPRDGVVGYGVVRFGEFYKGGLGYEGNGFVEGIGWYIEHTKPTVRHFDMDWTGCDIYLLHDEGELNKLYVYTGCDAFHHPEYLTKEVEDNNG